MLERAEAVLVLPGCSGGRFPGKKRKKKKAEKKEKADEDSEQRNIGRTSLKKWLRASRRRQAWRMMQRRLHKEQLGKVVKQHKNCSQIEKNAEKEDDWQKESS